MQVQIVLKEIVPLHETGGYDVFEIKCQVERNYMELHTCLRVEEGDSTGYCAHTIELQYVRQAAPILHDPFHWDGVSTTLEDLTACKKAITQVFFEACKRQSQLHQ